MNWHKDSLVITTSGKGLYPFTREVVSLINRWGVQQGMCYLYVQHTSASLVISESYDPSARIDLESFLERLVPENQTWMRHTLEGADDSSSHMRAMLTDTSLCIPVDDRKLNMGTWQGVYLFEHRSARHQRRVLVRCLET